MPRSPLAFLSLTLALAVACGPDDTAGLDAGPGTDAESPGPDASVDPCAAIATCAAAGTTCSGSTLYTCAPDAAGCLVATSTDCADADQVCSDAPGLAQCVDRCFGVAAEDRCDVPDATCTGDVVSRCEPNELGCLVRREATCPDGCADGACVGLCPGAIDRVLGCEYLTLEEDTELGADFMSSYAGCADGATFTGRERVFPFTMGDGRGEMIVSVFAASRDVGLLILDGGDGTAACGTPGTCIAAEPDVGGYAAVTFIAEPHHLYYAVVDAHTPTSGGSFRFELTCDPAQCGDAYLNLDEDCDDGNLVDGDGCSSSCDVERHWFCEGNPSICWLTCGDGRIDEYAGETCDDGGVVGGDGCSDVCTIEAGFACIDEPSMCTISCGNGRTDVGFPEECDDANTRPGDGCSATCLFETGYYCEGVPSRCVAVTCGDSSIGPGEMCDPPDAACSGRCALLIPEPDTSAFYTGAITASDPVYVRTSERGRAMSDDAYHYDAWTFENPTAAEQRLIVRVNWRGGGTTTDGMLFAYDYPFNAEYELFHWVAGNDDAEGGGDRSVLWPVRIQAGGRLVLVLTTFPPTSTIGEYEMEVYRFP